MTTETKQGHTARTEQHDRLFEERNRLLLVNADLLVALKVRR